MDSCREHPPRDM
eukprot:gene27332-biopygen17830